MKKIAFTVRLVAEVADTVNPENVTLNVDSACVVRIGESRAIDARWVEEKVARTDREVITDLMKRARIEFTEEPNTIDVEHGYAGFHATLIFNPDGALVDLRAEES